MFYPHPIPSEFLLFWEIRSVSYISKKNYLAYQALLSNPNNFPVCICEKYGNSLQIKQANTKILKAYIGLIYCMECNYIWVNVKMHISKYTSLNIYVYINMFM